jgi:hypothetical protein
VLLIIDLAGICALLIVILWLLRNSRRRAVRLHAASGSESPVLQEKEVLVQASELLNPLPAQGETQWEQTDFEYVTQPGTEAGNASSTTPHFYPMEISPIHSDATAIPLMIEEKNYADPIDGMPFEPGEPVIACRCGLAYRGDSVHWLHVHNAGRCAQCRAEINLPNDFL